MDVWEGRHREAQLHHTRDSGALPPSLSDQGQQRIASPAIYLSSNNRQKLVIVRPFEILNSFLGGCWKGYAF